MTSKRSSKSEGESPAAPAPGRGGKRKQVVSPPGPASAVAQPGSTAEMQEKIRKRAYEIYLARGGRGGTDEDDWLKAEAEILGITGGG